MAECFGTVCSSLSVRVIQHKGGMCVAVAAAAAPNENVKKALRQAPGTKINVGFVAILLQYLLLLAPRFRSDESLLLGN